MAALHCAISALKISKEHFATFDFFVKMKLVSTVWVSMSLSKSGYFQVYVGTLASSKEGRTGSGYWLIYSLSTDNPFLGGYKI